jgi:hypothetical protein
MSSPQCLYEGARSDQIELGEIFTANEGFAREIQRGQGPGIEAERLNVLGRVADGWPRRFIDEAERPATKGIIRLIRVHATGFDLGVSRLAEKAASRIGSWSFRWHRLTHGNAHASALAGR